ncbi:MAG: T9SS type A sorting domain-containing protein [Melioribacteraceae bacterium]|nr:T9SS type A sorting domain-containing protein [Melioribacteraceae bacterium]
MKHLIFLLFLSLSHYLYSQTNWQNIGPGAGSDFEAIAIHPTNSDIVYIAGDIEGVFKTTDGGSSWKNINSNLSVENSSGVYFVSEIVFDLSDATYNSVYLCTSVGLFLTSNGGDSWKRIFPSLINSEEDYMPISYIAIDPANPSNLFVGIGEAHSDEEGTGTIYKSIDKGSNWEEVLVASGDAVIQGIFIDPKSQEGNRIIYTSTNKGFYKSTDNGKTWSSKNNGLPHSDLNRLHGVYVGDNLQLFLTINTNGTIGNAQSFNGGIYKSTDNAESWFSINGNLPTYQTDEDLFYYYWKFTVNPQNTDIIYIGTTRSMPNIGAGAYEGMGIYKTTNGGTTWDFVSSNIDDGWMKAPFFDEKHAFVLELAPSNPNVIYWGLVWVIKSANAGSTWKQVYTEKKGDAWHSTGLELLAVEGIGFDPQNPDNIYIGYDDFGPFKSEDGGESFRPLDEIMDPYEGYDAAKEIIIDPENGDLFISRHSGLSNGYQNNFDTGQIWFSSDDGDTWIKRSAGLPDGRPKLIMDETLGSPGNRTLYCAIYHHGIYKSTNSGLSWTQINNGIANDSGNIWEITINPNNNEILYLGTNSFMNGGSIYKSENAGSSWSKLNSFSAMDILSIKVDNSNNLYVAATNSWEYSEFGGMYKSIDGGNSWDKILDKSRIVDIAIDPTDNNLIYAANQNWYIFNDEVDPGIFRSKNGGADWENITANLGHTFIKFIELHPNNPNLLFLGTDGGGVWVTDLVTDVNGESDKLPNTFELYQNYPNPFNPSTIIFYKIKENSHVQLKVYNILGQEIKTLVNKNQKAGNYKIEFNGNGLASGLYFYRIQAGTFTNVKKMLLIK